MTIEVLLLVLLCTSSVVGIGLGVTLLLVSADLRFYRRLLEEVREDRDELIDEVESFEDAIDGLQAEYDGLADAAVEAIGHLSGVDQAIGRAVGALAAALDRTEDPCECCPHCCGCAVDEDEPDA